MNFPNEFNPVAVYVYGIPNKAKALGVDIKFAQVGFEALVSTVEKKQLKFFVFFSWNVYHVSL